MSGCLITHSCLLFAYNPPTPSQGCRRGSYGAKAVGTSILNVPLASQTSQIHELVPVHGTSFLVEKGLSIVITIMLQLSMPRLEMYYLG